MLEKAIKSTIRWMPPRVALACAQYLVSRPPRASVSPVEAAAMEGARRFLDGFEQVIIPEYAAALARSGGSDTITVQALGADGDEVEATMVLNANSQVIAETSHTRAVAPSDPAAVAYLRVHTRLIDTPPPALPETGPSGAGAP